MQSIYSALLYCSRNLSKKSTPEFISAILETNNLDEKKIPDVEVDQINKCELDLLESLDFKLDYKLPFDYVDQYVRPYLSKLDLEIQKNLQNKLPCNLCVILCSERCINYPAEIMAVAATINSFENIPFPEEIFQWISFEREKFGASEIDNVCLLLREELDAIASK
ncbi:hypothetical protein GPJ56_008963 [Histomonas meleagridis]|uniref:uncharacterized protein n=1 Tax=Histomonas meleagridis TaxID=135588 RepID=UPI003559FF65|nr:hypothetical protein GPJ56_008963 [Histomonas meleagridis]KAH0805682.1 hypothetical protein GO595_001523 [Histomonas meleagridis]